MSSESEAGKVYSSRSGNVSDKGIALNLIVIKAFGDIPLAIARFGAERVGYDF
ncbi:hypothetical protein [Iodobacter sp. LRB]|uniref:hypothetical protein n=1 Tax=Iodobacter sp. LRB TaxID=3127955 RepID=UPI002683B466